MMVMIIGDFQFSKITNMYSTKNYDSEAQDLIQCFRLGPFLYTLWSSGHRISL